MAPQRPTTRNRAKGFSRLSAIKPTRARRVTLEDVAQHAKVSRALVSIVIRGAPGASETTRRRVFAAARELGYRPDARARALAGQRTRLIGVTFGLAGTFRFDLLGGLYEAAERHHHGLLLSALTPGRSESQAVDSLRDFNFDGLIMLGPAVANPVVAGSMPVVVVGWHVVHPGSDIVRTSDEAGMDLAVQHLVGLGHSRIVHLDGGVGLVAESRRRAYVEAMRSRGLGGEIQIFSGGEDQLAGHRGARALIDQVDELPTAIVAFNDDVAVAAMGVLSQHGIELPRQISVIGWDDSSTAGLAHVDLTSVAQNPREMARLAVERVIARCDGHPIDDREIVLPPRLTIRSSTSAPPRRRRPLKS
jgi:DNA-binding LacI/PurR family transcriptional regulator